MNKKLYRNKDWLEKQYLDNQLSSIQIAKLCDCVGITIRRWLKKLNISIRSSGESNHLKCIKRIDNNNYCNKNWLNQKYWKEKLSLNQIAEICNCNNETIRYWFKKFDILTRSRGEGTHLSKNNHCNLSKEARQWLDGELMGDGHLEKISFYSARFTYSSKHEEYIKYVSDILKSFNIKQTGKVNKYYHKEMDCCTYNYESSSYVELLSIRKRWYPNGHKIIPKDLKLTPLTCRQWYIGDGGLIHKKKRRPYILLATYGFPISDVKWLVEQLNELRFKVTRQFSDNGIYISTKSTKQFLDYIGQSPVKCYQYKFNYYK